MRQNMFFPIYQSLEKELVDLSFYISFDKKQRGIYSIKIADLILRTVSEIENLASELCKVEKIKFRHADKIKKDQNGKKVKIKGKIKKIVFFHEYISELNKNYDLEHRNVEFVHESALKSCFNKKLPFQKYLQKDGKEVQNWYFAYNQIKHDRIRNYKYANLENLVEAMAALFLLNVYYKDEESYTTEEIEYGEFLKNMEKKLNFSKVFEFAIGEPFEDFSEEMILEIPMFVTQQNEITSLLRLYSTFVLFKDIKIKTKNDIERDTISPMIKLIYSKKFYNQNSDNWTNCTFYAKLNKTKVKPNK